MEQPIDTLEIPTRVRNNLRAAGIETVDQLVSKTGRELVTLPNIGEKALEEIEEALEKEGLSLETQDLSDLGEEAG